MNQASSVEEYKQISSFQSLCQTLGDEKFADRMSKPLAYWALQSDRRLPLAFLGRTLGDLISKSYEELAATPGIGRRKMGSLLRLLTRATKETPIADTDAGDLKRVADRSGRRGEFDPGSVSEAVWERWRHTVRGHGLAQEKLGRFVQTLQLLPTVIWQAPLENYLDYSLAELRELRTHGEKRVRVILDIFHGIHELLGHSRVENHLTARLVPKFILPIKTWIESSLKSPETVSMESAQHSLAAPLVHQIHIDCGQPMARLVEARIGVQNAAQTVRVQSKRLGVTRARIYQLFEECEQAMNVRWPEGRLQLGFLHHKLESVPSSPEGAQIVRACARLFFPDAEEMDRRGRES